MNKNDLEIKDIPGYEGSYAINKNGYLWSYPKGTRSNTKGKWLRSANTSNNLGYQKINLYRFQKRKTFLLHRLVALTFIPNPENKPCVNHIDGNPYNNSIENLEWVTHSENALHAFHITKKRKPFCPTRGLVGKYHPCSKPIFMKKNNKIIEFSNGREFAKLNSCNTACITRARKLNVKNYTFKRGKAKGITIYFEKPI